MKYATALLTAISFITFQIQPTVAGVDCGSDDFDDNIKNTNLWGTDLDFGPDGGLVETHGRLEFWGTGPAIRPYAWSYRSYGRDWETITDVSLGDVQLNQPDSHVQMFIVAANRADTNLISGLPGDHLVMVLDLYSSTGVGAARTFEVNFRTDWNELEPRTNVLTASEQAGLRISFDATSKTLTGWYDANGSVGGYDWTALRSRQVDVTGSNWQMTSNSTFAVFVGASCESFDVTSNDLVYVDTFMMTDQARKPLTESGCVTVQRRARQAFSRSHP